METLQIKDLSALKEAILGSPLKILITTHHKPDADALGSSLALWGFLKSFGHDVMVVTPSDYPEFLNWMDGNEHVVQFDKSEVSKKQSEELAHQAELIFCLDFSSINRINDFSKAVQDAKGQKVLIDHHLNPEDFCDFKYWDIKAAATCELIYRLINEIGLRDKITPAIACCLYAGIMTDTGSFRHPSVTVAVHQIVAELISLGAEVTRVHQLIYDNNSLERLRFLGFVLAEKLIVDAENHFAYIAITAEELKRFHSQTGDTEGVVNYALSVKGVVLAALFVDRTEMVKISFRSNGDFSANEFARTHFEGGGHKNASGGKSGISLEATVQKFLSIIPNYKAQLAENAKK